MRSLMDSLLQSVLLGLTLAAPAGTLHFGRRLINEKTTGFISLIAGTFLTGFGLFFLYQTIKMLI
jgi:ABC-type nickel/cobalt efflux system permease component RcnA